MTTRSKTRVLALAFPLVCAQCGGSDHPARPVSVPAHKAPIAACEHQEKWAERMEHNEAKGELYRAVRAAKLLMAACSSPDQPVRDAAIRLASAIGDWETVRKIASLTLSDTSASPSQRRRAEGLLAASNRELSAPSEQVDVDARLAQMDALRAQGDEVGAKRLRDTTIISLERQIATRLGVPAAVEVDAYEPFNGPSPVHWSSDGSAIVVADGTVVAVLDTTTHRPRFRFQVPGAAATDIVVSPTNSDVASCWSDKTARVWNLRTGKLLWEAKVNGCSQIAADPTGEQLAVASGKRITTLRFASGEKRATYATTSEVTAQSWSNRGSVVFATVGGELWEWSGGEKAELLGRGRPGITGLAFRPGTQELAIRTGDRVELVQFPELKRLWHVDGTPGFGFENQHWSLDGSRLALCDHDDVLILEPDGTKIDNIGITLQGFAAGRTSAALAPTGEMVAFVVNRGLKVYRVGKKPPDWTLRGWRNTYGVTAYRCTVLADSTVVDVCSGLVRRVELGSVSKVSSSFDGSVIAGGWFVFGNHSLGVALAGTQSLKLTLPGSRGVSDFALSRDGSALLITDGHEVGLWETESQSFRWQTPAHDVRVVALDSHSRLAVTGSFRSVALLDATTGTTRQSLSASDFTPKWVEFAPNSTWLVAFGHEDHGILRAWSVDGTPKWSVASEASAMTVHPSGRWVVLGHDDGFVSIRDAETGVEQRRFPVHGGRVESIAWVDATLGVSTSMDGVRLWSFDGNVRATLHFPNIKHRTEDAPLAWTVVGAGDRPLVEVMGHEGEGPAGFQCRIGDRLFPWRLCYGVFHEPDLLQRSLSEPDSLQWP